MPRIQNIDQLRAEIGKLKVLKEEQERQLRSDFENVRNDFKPINILLRTLTGITGIRLDKNVFLKDGLFYGFSLLFQRLILKAEKKAEDTVYGFVDILFQRIQDFIQKHASHEARRDERSET